MSKLFSPTQIREVKLKNRITVSPMCQYSSEDGFSNNWHLVHLGSRAAGGAGLIITEAAAVSPEGRITPDDLGIWKDEHVAGLREIVQFAEEQGAVMGIQIAHAGRKASTTSPWKGGELLPATEGGWQTLAPSALPFFGEDPAPTALDNEGVTKVINDFKSAAARSRNAGFKVLEIHAAHGYLLHQFLSPLSNQRKDGYGGSFHNRLRLLLEVVRAVQEEWPTHLPLFVRISTTDWAAGGWDPESSVKLAALLKEAGVDLLDCSSGGLIPGANIPVAKGYQTQFAKIIKAETGILTGAVGLITKAAEAEEILVKEEADLVFIGRELLRNPYFPLEAARELGVDTPWPNQYLRAKEVDNFIRKKNSIRT